MTAAHQGKPRPLPGSWRPAPDLVDPSVPDQAQLVGVQAAPERATPDADAARAAVRNTVVSQEPGDGEPTASIGHPVPKADVGGLRVKRDTSILDIIMGDGGSRT